VITLTGPWDRLGAEGRAPLKDPDLDLVLIRGHYAHEPRVRFSLEAPDSVRPAPPYPATGDGRPTAAVPYRLRLPAGWVPGEDSLARLLDLARDDGYGLVSVLLAEGSVNTGGAKSVESTESIGDSANAGGAKSAEGVESVEDAENPGNAPDAKDLGGAGNADDAGGSVRGDRRIVAARLERAAAFARAEIVLAEGEDLDDAVEDTFGVLWVDGETYGFLPEARPIVGRRGSYRARTEAEAEVARLTKEAERLRGQVTKWRGEAGTWRKSAVELRREVGGLRRELAAAKKVVQYGLLSSVKRAITRRR
jgi:hypothetical protein